MSLIDAVGRAWRRGDEGLTSRALDAFRRCIRRPVTLRQLTALMDTTWLEAEAAMRDILFLYRDLTEYRGFSGDHPTGTFRPWRWLACESTTGWGSCDDVRLLQEGSAVALIVDLIDRWDQGNGVGVERYVDALNAGRFDHLPPARAAIEAGVRGTDLPDFAACADVVYREYVLRQFATLAASARATEE